MLVMSLSSIVDASDSTKCKSLSNQQCATQPTLINLNPNEYTERLHYYSLAVNVDRCTRSCNTLNGVSDRICVLNKTEDLNLNVFNMIAGLNESKLLTKHVSCKCKYKFDGRKCH